jgi:hypothetical protein
MQAGLSFSDAALSEQNLVSIVPLSRQIFWSLEHTSDHATLPSRWDFGSVTRPGNGRG